MKFGDNPFVCDNNASAFKYAVIAIQKRSPNSFQITTPNSFRGHCSAFDVFFPGINETFAGINVIIASSAL